MERSDFRFSRRDVRAWAPWGDTVLKKHLGRLEDMEYLLVHRGGRGQSFVYELVFERGENPFKPQLPGLINVYDLRETGDSLICVDFLFPDQVQLEVVRLVVAIGRSRLSRPSDHPPAIEPLRHLVQECLPATRWPGVCTTP